VKPNNHAQNKHTFEGLSRKIQRHQTSNYYDELKRQEVIFFYLFVRKMEQFYTVDKYYITEMFYNVLGLAVNIIDKKHVFNIFCNHIINKTKIIFIFYLKRKQIFYLILLIVVINHLMKLVSILIVIITLYKSINAKHLCFLILSISKIATH